ncbi:hypothetical protein BBB56_11675 [Candidatus Pantoea deserta]|uniref:Uncharacterized protein n=1 Tax=Candidatus Pantoea deserta TaxID=1869313 RepID=A0A3N4NXH1_9GAMM|nr:hypothetical protein BBB56_11675 [Pantoea deserta]
MVWSEGKRSAARPKMPGACFNNVKRWPGRTSEMRCVFARAERAGKRKATLRVGQALRSDV